MLALELHEKPIILLRSLIKKYWPVLQLFYTRDSCSSFFSLTKETPTHTTTPTHMYYPLVDIFRPGCL